MFTKKYKGQDWTKEKIMMIAKLASARIQAGELPDFKNTAKALNLKMYCRIGSAFHYAGVFSRPEIGQHGWGIVDDNITDDVLEKIIRYQREYQKKEVSSTKQVEVVNADNKQPQPELFQPPKIIQKNVTAFQCPHCGVVLTITD